MPAADRHTHPLPLLTLRGRRGLLPLALAVLLGFALFAVIQRTASAATLDLSAVIDGPNTAAPGEPIQFVFSYQCSGVTGDCNDTTLTVPIDEPFSQDTADVSWFYDEESGHIGSASYDETAHTVDFAFNNAPDFQPGSSGTVSVLVTFAADTPGGTEGTIEGTLKNPALPPASASGTATAINDEPQGGFDVDGNKYPADGNGAAIPGQTLTYLIASLNLGDAVESLTTTDNIESDFLDVESVSTGAPNAGEATATISWEATGGASGTTEPVTVTPGAAHTYTKSELGVPADQRITTLTWSYAPLGAETRVNQPPAQIDALVLDVGAPEGDELINCAHFAITGAGAQQDEATDCTTVAWNVTTTGAVLAKSITAPAAGTVRNDDTVSWRLDITNPTRSSASLKDGLARDLLPEHLSYVDDSWTATSNTQPTFHVIDDYAGTGRTLLEWDLTGIAIDPGDTISIAFDTVVTGAVGDETIPNRFVYVPADIAGTQFLDNGCLNAPDTGDPGDLDGDGATDDVPCNSGFTTIRVIDDNAAALDAVMWIQGQLDDGFSHYPSTGLTAAGGWYDYEIRVSNVGSQAVDDVVFVDVLPAMGDTGILDAQTRGSEWAGYLVAEARVVNPDTGLADDQVGVWYSTKDNPCLPELESSPGGCNDAAWSQTLPADITTVTAVKFDFGGLTLDPGDSRALRWRMRAPDGAPEGGEVSWNSFAYGATSEIGTRLKAEPLKTGIAIEPAPPALLGDFVWNDTNRNGIQDPGEAGINGVEVTLYSAGPDGLVGGGDDTPVDRTISGPNLVGEAGSYLFPNLDPGTYFVQVTVPNRMQLTTPNVGEDDAVDSDIVRGADAQHGVSQAVTLNADDKDRTVDIGLRSADSIATTTTSTTTTSTSTTTTSTTTTTTTTSTTVPTTSTTTTSTTVAPTTTTVAPTTTTTTIPVIYDLALVKVVDDAGPLEIGDTITVTIGVRNQGNVDSGAYEVTDQVPDGFSVVSISDGGVRDGSFIRWSTATTTALEPGQEATYSVVLRLDNVLARVESPRAEISADSGDDVDSIPDALDNDAVIDRLSLDDLLTDISGDEDDSDIIVLELTEPVDAALGDFVFDDTNADGIQQDGEAGIAKVKVELLDADGAVLNTTTTDAAGFYRFDGLAAGEYLVRFTLPADMVASPSNVGAEATDSDGILDAGGATATTELITLAAHEVNLQVDQGLSSKPAGGFDLDITKTVNQPETRTGPVEWRIVVTNLGPDTAIGPITLTDSLPDELTVLSYDTDSLWDCELNAAGDGCGLGNTMVGHDHTWTCSLEGQEFGCVSEDDLPLGASLEVVITTTVDAPANAEITNTATVSSPSTETELDNNTASDTIRVVDADVDLILEKNYTSPTFDAEDTRWQVDITNAGPEADPGPILMTDSFPTTIELVEVEAPGWTCQRDTQSFTCVRPGRLEVGENDSITVITRVNAPPGTEVVNFANVSGSGNDINPDNNSDDASLTVPEVMGQDTSRGIAFTGSWARQLALVGLAGTFAGLILVIIGRRRSANR